ncbi:MAG TPA: RING finger protein [Planctomycetota bacterium]|nr:RING finger protein [Planctomycetota bacterium]
MSGLVEMSREVAKGIPGARVLPGGGLAFMRRGFRGRVEFGRSSTDILFDLGFRGMGALQVRTAGLWHDILNSLGRPDHKVGDEEFDAAFDVSTTERGFAEWVLTPAIRKVLRGVGLYGRFLFRISGAGFLLRLAAHPDSARELDTWVVAAFQLLEAIPGTEGADRIQMVSEGTVIDRESACQICGGTLVEGALVRCAKCSTPHHRDCWEFNGRCSTFACGERRAVGA